MMLTSFVSNNYEKLLSGEKIRLPYWFNDLKSFGFREEFIAQPAGQIKDFVLPYKNGTRLHVHEFEDGSKVIHLDKHDPQKDFSSLVKHLFQETWIAPMLLVFVGLIFFSKTSR